MLKNYFQISLRNILRNKLFSTLNIMGLAFGMGSALLIFLWVKDEWSVDRFHAHTHRLYRVMENQRYSDGRIYTFAATPGPMAPFIKEKFPEIELASRFTWQVSNVFQQDEKLFYENGRYADPDFMSMFSFSLKYGDPNTALNDKHSIVISRAMAMRLFDTEEVIGKTLVMNTDENVTITGVMEIIPANSSLKFEYLLPFQNFWDENKNWLDQWGNNNIRTYLLLAEGTDAVAFESKLKHEILEHNKDSNVELFIQPFGDAYLYGQFEGGKLTGGRIEYVKIFFIVAVFVLAIACINFMNLATAQASKRAKEVGLRKVIGAVPQQVFRQFMGESFLMVLLSALLAFGLVAICIPFFNDLTGKQLTLNLLDYHVLTIALALIFVTSFLAGSYPALFIAGFKPVQVLKGQLKSGSKATIFRKALVVVQFSLSMVLIISTIVVYRQMEYMQNRDIGFERDNLFYVWMEGDMPDKFETVRNRLLELPGIESVTMSSQLPIDIGSSTMGLEWEGKDPATSILFTNLDVDYEFIQTMKMEMAEGRPFERSIISDSTAYIVNQKAAEKFGFTNGTANQDLTMWQRKGKIVGVVKDFNFGSLHSAIEPLVMRIPPRMWGGCIIVRAKTNETVAALNSAEGIFKEYAPGYPFRYSFLNQDWENFYKAEGQRGKIFNALAFLSILISCLGLFGLSAFSAERKIKELGIRKVLGATVTGLVQLMGKEFTVLVAVAALIGCPVGWYVMDGWLGNYPYRVEVGWITLAIATGSCLLVSVLTVIYHSLKASLVNPADSLRYE
ncbi:ABC transporter permease [Oscillatoria amoena NRMC-F 0135]|nr:ABC transporter permease [Oscillatoria amoena NRMC-F 0135]